MDPKFQDIFTSPENAIFKVVFFPDRIYHAQYLNATRSPRYRYNVQEVRSKLDITVLKGEVYLDGNFYSNFLRVEYRASRLVEKARERSRFLRGELLAFIRLLPENAQQQAEAQVKMHFCPWIDAYQVEIWETLEAPPNSRHDFQVLDMMGRHNSITRVKEFNPALREIKQLKRLELAFRENDRDLPFGYAITQPEWDNNFLGSHQEPRTPEPSSPQNTISDQNYAINFQRGWFRHVDDYRPVRYRNAMMEAANNPDAQDDNIIEMKWLLQREFGASLVFFHEVTIPPGKVEGTHQHIGSEELYYITEGEGLAYLRVGDDPTTDAFPTVEREVFGIGKKQFKELPVRPGSLIFTKSGGMHGIRNPGAMPLKFVAFLYHSS
jgi:mannose-6-phosphate isomerase-like protein (cupin superfamily)